MGYSRRASKTPGARLGLPKFLKPSGGKPIEEQARSRAEYAYGQSFKDVRVHTDSEAADSAAALDARAYTTGRDIVFGAGSYRPDTSDGQRLIAHELAHVIQQLRGTTSGISQPFDTHEQSAERAARGDPASLTASGTAPAIQRDALPTLRPTAMIARAEGSGTVDSFLTGSAALNSAQKSLIASVALNILSLRESYPGCSVSVTGHTDAVGTEADNMALGQARADAVRDELTLHGVPPEIIHTSSAGESQLKVLSQSAEAANRRAEISFEPESRWHGILNSTLTPPSLPDPASISPVAPASPPTKLFPPVLPKHYSDPDDETPLETSRRIFTPIPPAPETHSDKLLGPIFHKLDSLLKKTNLPDWAQDLVKDGVKAAIVKGVTAPADDAMDRAGVGVQEKKAIDAIIEGAIKGQMPKD